MRKLFLLLLLLSSQLLYAAPSLTDKISQMLIIGFRGFSADETSPIIQTLKQYPLGGVILFNHEAGKVETEKGPKTVIHDRNIHNPSQLKHLIQQLQQSSKYLCLLASIKREVK